MKKFMTATGEKPVLHRNTANLMQTMLDEVKASITIIPELKALIPPLQTAEFEQLTDNIRKDGCREPLLIWQTTRGIVDGSTDETPINVLIDGHNRHEICQQYGIDFKISLREFQTLQAVRDFMIDNQLGRRNLSPEQMSYLRGLKYRNERQAIGRPGQADSTTLSDEKRQRTNEKLAKEFNVSSRTIIRDGEYAEGIDRLEPTLRQDVLKGTTKLPKDVVREIGRTVAAEAPLLSLTEVETIRKKVVRSAEPLPVTTAPTLSATVQQIIRMANDLDHAHPEFGNHCNALIGLLTQARNQAEQ